ncbi:hypothetical protein DR871_006985 [Flavobacterium petrolei]|uniref:Trimeric autotransporter adhesin YadA-like stalk domain-containing protein n=1 Tax=Flavobacterium petrolei TaxID=2259594 RepID=A0A482TWM8_9FLAO|nr:hypothetical protein [Flavobacterium petrolei]RYJ51986.1 hypothetical protein DR871_006985 [Flavobacterium petrolei]
MKKIILLIFLFIGAKNFAQSNGITYQAVILNPKGEQIPGVNNPNAFLVSKDICMLFKFVDEFSNVEYQEVIQTKTDEFGMVNLIIGSGLQTAGYASSFDEIVWNAVSKKLIVAVNTNGSCSSFTEISNQPFNSVPTAFFAKNAENVTGVVPIENGGTNAVTVLGAKTNLGLENVDNTTDLNKPMSTASKLALNLKEDTINKSTNITTDGNSDIKYPTVKSVKNFVDSSVSFNLSVLNNEISRATLAENAIANNLVSETERATLAETTIATAITSETNRATLTEATLSTNLTTEVNRATFAESTLSTNLTTEVLRATTAEATKEDAGNKSTDGSFISNSDVKFPTEKAIKTYVDASALSNSLALNNEISRATTAENTVVANLATETNRATLTEATLATNLTDETNRATLAEATLSTNLTTEVLRATTAEATKEDAGNKSTDGSFISNSDVKFPTEKAIKTYVDASASSNSLALNNEISRATLAEATNVSAINFETTRATLAETTLSTNLTTEVLRATTAEATKEDAENKSTDGSFISNSDLKFPTEKATKTYVDVNIATSNSITQTLLDSKAPLESPIFTGTPFAPTPAAGTATTQIATTNFVTSAIADFSTNTSANFVDLTTNQTIAGTKIFTSDATINGVTVGRGKFNENSNAVIGNRADMSFDGITNSVAIGANAIVTASNTIQLGSDGSGSHTAVTNVNTSAVITASGYKIASGTALQYLMANGSVSTGAAVVIEIADEFNLTESVVTFSLSQTPSPNSKVKMYVNGVRISNSSYSSAGTILTYVPANNGNYALSVGDRIQFDYSF